MGWKEEKRLTRKIMIGLASTVLGLMPLDTAGVDIGVATAEAGAAGEAVPDVRLPEGHNVVDGSVKVNEPINTDGHAVMDVVQSSDKAIIDWNTFDVGKDATVNFIHLKTENNVTTLNTAASTLNRVTGGKLSEIAGTINSVGTFILVNPDGAVFSKGSEVNAAGIVVSTADITNDNYKKGNLWFEQNKNQNANIIMDGSMNAETGTDTTTNSGANKVLKHITDLKNEKTSLEAAAADTASEEAAAAAQAKLDTLQKTAGDLITLNVTELKPATGFAVGANGIKLVADGDIFVGANAAITATAKTDISGDMTVGVEEFEVDGGTSSRTGSIVLRADQNADDVAAYDGEALKNYAGITDVVTYDADGKAVAADSEEKGSHKTAKVYLSDELKGKNKIQSQHIGIYYDADIVGDIKGTDTAAVVPDGAASDKFTQKNYKETAPDYKSKVSLTGELDATRGESYSTTFAMLVNDVYQLKAIDDATYGNLGGSYAQGTSINAAETANWNSGKGFEPIGDASNPFKGSFTGSGGSNGYSISNLSINRPDENNVGLFAKVEGGSVWSLTLVDPGIKGRNYVGGAAGEGVNAHFEGVTIRKSAAADAAAVNINGENSVGGVVGAALNSSIRSSVNESSVSGGNNVGGIVGMAVGSRGGYTIDRSKNKAVETNSGVGSVTGSGSYTGGLVGVLRDDVYAGDDEAQKGPEGWAGKAGSTALVSESVNNGRVSGRDYTGGIVGAMYGTGTNTVSVKTTYNTNEGTTLGTKIGEESTGAGTSDFGRVTGKENVGGLAGYMNNSEIETAYNAGNVTGEKNVGGVTGKMEGSSSISKAYNADNNTVLVTAAADEDIDSAANNAYYGFTVKKDEGYDVYQYDQSKQQWIKNNDTENLLTTEKVLEEAPESVRTYNNRLAYRDAVVTGNKNVGGVVGYMENGTINQVYNAGRVNCTSVETSGDFGGTKNGGTVKDSFYVTKRQDGKDITTLGRAFGTGNVSGVDAKTLYEATNIKTDKWSGGVSWTGTSNQNENWMIYSNSATPLLKHFMKKININRQYEYDGTTHNLVTTDVDNFYGGAFFEGEGKGRYVTTEGIDTVSGYDSTKWKVKSGTTNAADINGKSSVYTYENADMWSPQHGYFVDPNAAVIIVPRTLKAEVTGEKTYGQDAVSGAVIVDANSSAEEIKNAQNGGANYAIRFVNDTTGKTGFVNGEDAYSHDEMKGVLNVGGEALTVGEDGKVKISGGGYNDDTKSLDAGTYNEAAKFTHPELKSDHNNYKIVYTDKLTVNKADLYFTAEGTREYGEANKASDFHYTAAAVSDSANDTLNNGSLKSWDNTAEGNIDDLITNRGTAAVTVKSKTAAKTGKTTSDKNITEKSWVKNTEDKAYTIAKGSFESDGKSELLSKNYNLIFVDNVEDASLADKKGKSTYAITPVDLAYNIVGTRKYGDAMDKTVYDVTAADASKLKNGDKISDVASSTELNAFASGVVNTLKDAGKINTDHVKRDAANKVVCVYDDEFDTTNSVNHIQIKDANPNYNLTAHHLQYTVTPAELIYKADDNTKVYGNTAMDNAFSGGFTAGFVNGDSADGVYVADSTEKVKASEAAGTASYSTKIDADKNVTDAKTDAGTYNGAIQASGLKLNDYEIKYEAGNATVTPRDINIEYTVSDKTKVYGETNPILSADSDINVTAGFVNGDTLKNNEYTFAGMPEKNQKADVGTYDLDLKDKDWQKAVGGNYKVDTVTANKGTLTVTPKEISLAVDDKSKVYGNDNPELTGTFTGMLDGDTHKKVSYKTDAGERSHVGDYGISVDYGDKEHTAYWQDILGKNYTLKDENVTNGSLHITPRSISYKADDATREAGSDKEPVLGGGFVLGKKGESTGFMSWDLPKLEAYNLSSGDFTTDTTKESEPGDYLDDIRTAYSKEELAERFGADESFRKDYEIVDVLPGTMHVIVKRGLTPSFSSNPRGNSPLPGVVPISDDTAVIDGQGMDMPKEAVAPRPIDDESKNHPNVSFRPADEDEEESDREKDIIWKEVSSDNVPEADDGGEIERERRGSLRFLTIEDTGINVKPAALSANTITVDASSRSDGGSTVVIENVHDDIRVIGTKPLLKGTTIDTLKESAVIRDEGNGKRFKPAADLAEAERSKIFSETDAESAVSAATE
ncbi:MAG: MBG domain-containing protein [Schwartzia succinivorans]|nr:MBG domain-containing protein [Schwartzia succinivorans]